MAKIQIKSEKLTPVGGIFSGSWSNFLCLRISQESQAAHRLDRQFSSPSLPPTVQVEMKKLQFYDPSNLNKKTVTSSN